jgi:hypothetical protein
MASIHCVAPSPAALQQQHKVVESEATCDSPMASALQQTSFSAAQASSSANRAAAAHEVPADSSANAPCADNPNPSDKATARSASTRTSLLLLFGACATAAIATLVLLMLRPAAFISTKTAAATFAAKQALPIVSQYGRYTVTHDAAPMSLHYTRAAAALTSTPAVSNAPAGTPKKAAAAAGEPQALLQPASAPAPVNMMLSCPKEWQCRYPQPQLAPWLTGELLHRLRLLLLYVFRQAGSHEARSSSNHHGSTAVALSLALLHQTYRGKLAVDAAIQASTRIWRYLFGS